MKLLYFLLLISVLSCSFKRNDEVLEKIKQPSVTSSSTNTSLQTKIPIDTAICGVVLRNAESVLNNFGDLMPMVEHDLNFGEVASILNKNRTEVFRMKIEYGGFQNQFSYFYVTSYERDSLDNYEHSHIEHFISSNGIYLGMSIAKFERTKFATYCNKAIDHNKIQFHYEDDDFYNAYYFFVDDQLSAYSFGFQNP